MVICVVLYKLAEPEFGLDFGLWIQTSPTYDEVLGAAQFTNV